MPGSAGAGRGCVRRERVGWHTHAVQRASLLLCTWECLPAKQLPTCLPTAVQSNGLEPVRDWIVSKLPESPSLYPKVRQDPASMPVPAQA